MKNTKLVSTVSIAIFGFSMTVTPLSAEGNKNDQAAHAHKEAHADHMLKGFSSVSVIVNSLRLRNTII